MRGGIVAIGLVGVLLCACTGGGSDPSTDPASSDPVTSSTPSTSVSTPPPLSLSMPKTSTAPVSSSPAGPKTTGPNVQPGEKPPIVSTQAEQHTTLGAIDFAAYYVKALDWSIATNDSYLVRQVSLPSCTECNRVIAFLASLNREGQLLQGGRITIRSAENAEGSFNFVADITIRMILHQQAQTRGPVSGPKMQVAAASTTTSLIFLDWTRAGWRVSEVANP